jgi:SAM-dependent methyltransferase
MSAPASAITVFDRTLLRQRRTRAAGTLASADFLKTACAELVADRLADVARPFARVLDLGCHTGWPNGSVVPTVSCDLSPAMASRAPGLRLVADEEWLPFADASFDLVVSAGSLHWVNDLPGTLIQINRALVPDGLFLGALLGGETLFELRHCLMAAEEALTGGAAPRVSPFLDVRDGGSLLQRAGFAMPVAEVDRIDVTYDDPFKLLIDLRAMGETSVLLERPRKPLRRDVLAHALALYRQRHARPDGRVAATFQIITLCGWAPGPDQPKPLRPGSATARLADALGTTERPAGDKAGR